MRQSACLVLAVLAVSSVVLAQTVTEDITLKVTADPAEITGTPGGTAEGDVAFSVLLDSQMDEIQGWSFGAIVQPGEGLETMEIIGAENSPEVEGLVAEQNYLQLNLFAAGDLEQSTEDFPAVAVTQGVILDFNGEVVLNAAEATDFPLANLTVHMAGDVPEVDENSDPVSALECGSVVLSNEIGKPTVDNVVTIGGASFFPAETIPAEVCLAPSPLVPPAEFTIEIEGGEGPENAEVFSDVMLNFDSIEDKNGGEEIQGWSYGICIDDTSKLGILDATTDSTETATVKNGNPPDYNNVNTYDEGVTHAVVIDFSAQVAIGAQNGWHDLVVTYEILTNAEGDSTFVAPCNETLGSPAVSNVMVVQGQSIDASAFEGRDPADPDTGCENPEVCNQPGIFSYLAVPPKVFLPGDANADCRVDIADGIYILNALFRGGTGFPCTAAADFNGDGAVDASDAIAVIYWRFQPETADMPGEGWPGPALGTECGDYSEQTDLPCETPSGCCTL